MLTFFSEKYLFFAKLYAEISCSIKISFIVLFFSDVGVAIGNKNRYLLVQVHSATVMDSKYKMIAKSNA